jgi:hypothetical protein
LVKVVLSKFFLSQLPGIASAYSPHVCPAVLSWEKIDACDCGHPRLGGAGCRADRIHPPWAYTTGLTACGRPELVVTGMPVRRAGRLLNDVAAHVIHAEPPRPGEQVRLTGGPLIEIVRVAEPSAHLATAVALYGPQIRALQVVHADDAGQWPWERGYRGVRGGQPVLGPRARRAAGRRRSA